MSVKVMLIDDDPATLLTLVHSAQQAGLEAHGFPNATQALHALSTEEWQVVVCDHHLPDSLGIDVCQHISNLSPATYRILLSGRVEAHQLEHAVRDGHIHRFIAKPWNNRLLIRYIRDGARQALLLHSVHRLKSTVTNEHPALVADKNWIIRMANQRFCQLLGMDENQIFGRNLFSPHLFGSPLTIEPEITRQVEDSQTWLGDFVLFDHNRHTLLTRMAITAINTEHRICCCLPAVSETSTRELLPKERQDKPKSAVQMANALLKQGYAGHTILMVRFPPLLVSDQTSNHSCATRLQQAVEDNVSLQSIEPHVFVLYESTPQQRVTWDTIESSIQTAFQTPIALYHQTRQITPSCYQLQVSDQHHHLAEAFDQQTFSQQAFSQQAFGQQALGKQYAPSPMEPGDPSSRYTYLKHSDQHSTVETDAHTSSILSEHIALPIFNQSNTLSALLMPEHDHQSSPLYYQQWHQVMQTAWQEHLSSPMQMVINSYHMSPKQLRTVLDQFPSPETRQNIWIVVDIQHVPDFYRSGCHLMVRPPHQPDPEVSWLTNIRSYLNSDSTRPDGICLLPNRFSYLKSDIRRGCKKLEKLQQSGLMIWACDIDSTEALAAAHQCGSDWLSGNALSPPLTAHQLGWFAH